MNKAPKDAVLSTCYGETKIPSCNGIYDPPLSSKDALPCPFCGEAEIYVWDCEVPHKGFRVGCVSIECDINPYTRTIWTTKEEALKSWNKRKESK